MNLANGTPAAQTLLAAFETAARAAAEAEADLRKKMEADILRLERQRAFAYRRLYFMRALAQNIQPAESDEAAIAIGYGVVRTELSWKTESESRAETLSRLAPVIRATFSCLASQLAEPLTEEVVKSLGEFETWYATRFEQSFWMLFEQQIEELPVVER